MINKKGYATAISTLAIELPLIVHFQNKFCNNLFKFSGHTDGTVMLWDTSKNSCSLPWNKFSYEYSGSLQASGVITSLVYDGETLSLTSADGYFQVL